MILYACSSNRGKLGEFALAGRASGIPGLEIEPLPGLAEIAPPEETGTTFEENARAKAEYYSSFTSELVIADDSGLVVPALSSAPGIYSSRYAGPGATSEQNNALLLHNLRNVEDRSAYFICVVAVARAGTVLASFEGRVNGSILENPSGAQGFGYDPLFFYPPFEASFGALEEQKKFAVSHRGNALRKLFAWLQSPASPIH